ncbi:DHA2 family efflux MFS transporter permease subunit [Staphylococcus canis]|uniref:Quinolone resistance protein NorB n=1 Tax=Staphylococcus canis TaxID=2724942 RepID=A0ABS0T5E9_9STAP|nr:DHA2 family efflux MFS transporter permease subunit [Staphylococcus canis]MBI5973975.1 multidrug efflux MFS transporter [Staphylococcus canis]
MVKEKNYNKIIMTVFLIGAFFMTLNETLLYIALPELMHYFDLPRTVIQWLASGFMMVMGIVYPLSALIIQWFTTRRLYLGLIVIFSIGSLIAGFAVNFPMLLAGRMIQAIGTGLMIALITNTMLFIFDKSVRGKAIGTFSLVVMFAPAIGPTLSGVIIEALGWRWLFFIVLPFMILTFILGAIFLKNVGEVTRPKVDILSIIFSTVGITGIIYSISNISQNDGIVLTPLIAITFVIGIVFGGLFVYRQLRLDTPILDFRVFLFHNYRKGMMVYVVILLSMFPTEIVLPMYLQGPVDLPAKIAGLVLLPGALINGLLSPIMGGLFDKFGPRKLIVPGLIALLGVSIFYIVVQPELPIFLFVLSYFVLMAGISTVMTPIGTNSLNALPSQSYPHGSAIYNMIQPVVGAIGISTFIAMITGVQNAKLKGETTVTQQLENEAMTSGLHVTYLFALILIIIGIVIALTITNASKEKED